MLRRRSRLVNIVVGRGVEVGEAAVAERGEVVDGLVDALGGRHDDVRHAVDGAVDEDGGAEVGDGARSASSAGWLG